MVSTPSQGVATTTSSAPAAPSLSAGWSGRLRPGHRSSSSVTVASARSIDREPTDDVDADISQLHGYGLSGRPGRSEHSDVHQGRLARPARLSRPGGDRARLATVRPMRLIGRLRRAPIRAALLAPSLIRPRPESVIGTRGDRPVRECGHDGHRIEVKLEDRSAVLLFLTGSCYGCRPLWDGAGRAATAPAHLDPPARDRDPEPDDGERPGDRRPGHRSSIAVVMSSEVWHAYRVAQAPWCVRVADGSGDRRRRRHRNPGPTSKWLAGR